jgi:small-conductance mechanosensitive channel
MTWIAFAPFALALAFAGAGAAQQPPPATAQDTVPADTAGPPPPSFPVVLGTDTVLVVRARLGSFTAAERAAAIQQRLAQLARNRFGTSDSLVVVEAEGATDLVAGDRILLSVTEADAAAEGVGRADLAARYAGAIRQALEQQGLAARWRTIVVGMLFALLTTVATVLLFRFTQRFFFWLRKGVVRGRNTWVPSIRIQKLELLSAERAADFLLWFLGMLRVLVLALMLYVTVPVILSFFPWTRAYADRLFGYIITPFASIWNATLEYVPNLFIIGAIAIVTWYLLKLIHVFFAAIERGALVFTGFYAEWAIPTYKLVRALVMIFAFVMMWPYLPGSDSPAFQGVGVILGLLISFGSASAIGNMVGGIVLTYMRPFKVGDRVKIADTVGDIVERTLLVTRIRTIKNVEITIPNAMVLGSHIINYSATAEEGGVVLHTGVTIGYDVPWRHVHELLVAAATDTDGIVVEPKPFVLQTSLDDFYVAYELNAATREPRRMAEIYSLLHANIQDRFNAAGVEIMSPHYRAARDGNAAALPPTALPEGYRPPGFRVDVQSGP